MRVGHGSAPIVVLPGEPMGGYADRVGGVDGEGEPLEVHAMAVSTAENRFVLLVVDLACVNTDVVEAIRGDLGVDACWVAATHTHAGPEPGCRPGGDVTPPALADRLVHAARSAVEVALRNGVPATIEAPRRTMVDGLGGRRSATSPEPQVVPVDTAVVRDVAGRLIGMLVVQPVHPTVLPAANRRTSADLSGALRRAVASRLPGDPWVLVATGAAGDLSTRHTRRGRDEAELDRLGALAADAITATLAGATPAPAPDGLRGPVESSVVLAPKDADDLPGLAELRRRPRPARTFEQGLELATELLGATVRPAEHRIRLEAVSVGGVDLVAVPGELFLNLGELIRAGSRRPEQTVVLGYANGYLGYLPAREAFEDPDYEVLVSPVRRGSGEQVAQAAAALTAELDRP
jgi:hypothetical protein